jgi:hypothetical protein
MANFEGVWSRDKSRRHGDPQRGVTIQKKDTYMKQPAIYIMANQGNGTLYTGVATDLVKRVHEHKTGACDGFTKKYNCKKLVSYELH